MENFDYVILGAGSAGCVLANRLSANPNHKVLLIEAGSRDTNPWIHIPGGYFKTMLNPKTDWCFQTEKEEFCDNREMVYPRGKTLGGSSSINGMLYSRGQSNDFDYWRQLGNVGWSWEDVLPYFKKSEDFQFGENEFHGSGGPLAVQQIRGTFKVCDLFMDAAEEFGHKRTDDFNNGDNEGMGYFPFTVRNGLRCSTAVGYLNPVKKRKNLKIVVNAHVQKINFNNNTVDSVSFFTEDKLNHIKVNKEAILSAGAIGSPHLLQISGIGDGEKIKKHGIEVVHELKGVGKNLQDHLMFRPVYKLKNIKSLNRDVESFYSKFLMGLQYIFKQSGPITMGASQVCAFTKSDPSRATPNLQFHVQPLSTDILGVTPMHDFEGITPTVANIRPSSLSLIHI